MRKEGDDGEEEEEEEEDADEEERGEPRCVAVAAEVQRGVVVRERGAKGGTRRLHWHTPLSDITGDILLKHMINRFVHKVFYACSWRKQRKYR